MNRKARRAGQAGKVSPTGGGRTVDVSRQSRTADLMAQANWHHQRGQFREAEQTCAAILKLEPSHVNALNLSGLIAQALGRHKQAAKALTEALSYDEKNPACHYNLACSLQTMDRLDEATTHFQKAIELGIRLKSAQDLILQNPAIASCVDRVVQKWPLPIKSDELFARYSLEVIAKDRFLHCALRTVPLHHAPLEKFLTATRKVLLDRAAQNCGSVDPIIADLFCALAQQCFLNEYVFAQSEEETGQASQLQEQLVHRIAAGETISPLLLAAVAAYFPLHSLPNAQMLLTCDTPRIAVDLVRQQVAEPLEELEDRRSIPVLTEIDDVSLRVMDQYCENPYPRWTVNPVPFPAEPTELFNAGDTCKSILVAGCGTGKHAVETAQLFPSAQVLAIDLSLPSLAYARRKSRELGLRNIDYAQADILKLAGSDRLFDRIEAVGVLHHLADPETGWRILLSRLRPGGKMRLGLYSETGRRDVSGVRAFIADRGYRPVPDDIRKLRQEILRIYDARGWRITVQSVDFYNMSGCRDLLFNVIEHRFTIARIKRFLSEQGLSFLQFDVDASVVESYRRQFPAADLLNALDNWDSFEESNPSLFTGMYQFTIEKP